MRSDVSQNLTKSLSLILATDLTPKLRQMALESGWPSYIISQLEVRLEGEEMYIYYPDEIKEAVENLEYGDINSLPNAVLRPFMLRAGQVSSSPSNKILIEELLFEKLGGVL